MPRVQVYLPDDLHAEMKAHDLSPSELLQRAIRVEARRRRLLGETDDYLAELTAEVGVASAEEDVEARAFADRLARHLGREAAECWSTPGV